MYVSTYPPEDFMPVLYVKSPLCSRRTEGSSALGYVVSMVETLLASRKIDAALRVRASRVARKEISRAHVCRNKDKYLSIAGIYPHAARFPKFLCLVIHCLAAKFFNAHRYPSSIRATCNKHVCDLTKVNRSSRDLI